MLKQRIITALVLIVLLLLAIFKLNPFYFSLLLGVFVLFGAWEWLMLIGVSDGWWRSGFFFAIVMILAGLSLLTIDKLSGLILMLSVVWWISNFRCMRPRFTLPVLSSLQRYYDGGIGLLVLIPTWLAVVTLHSVSEQGPILLLFLMVLIWTADSSAFFAGRQWGQTKLAPHISPGKSWEGAQAAGIASILMGLVGATMLGLSGFDLVLFTVLCVVTVVFSIMGDLFESLYKRRIGVKDSGRLLPGHGGVLDRIDSLTAAAPVFASGVLIMDFSK